MTVLAASSHHPQQFARFDFALALSASKFRGIRVSENQTSSANGRLSRERESQIGVMGERREERGERNPKHLPARDEYHPQRDQIEFQPPGVGSGDKS